jgi:streptogramin lyase
MAGIFDVASSATPFTPALTAAPLEWTLPLVFTIRNYGPLAIDAAGHVWLLAPDPNSPSGQPIPNLAVAEIDADGTFLSPHQTGHDWSGGGVSSIQGNDVTNLAIDQTGNVWVSGTGSTIAELTSAGAGFPGAPWNAGTGPDDTAAVSIDSAGNAWFASGNTQSSVFELSQAGVNKSGATGYSTANCPCNGMAADPLGNVWTVSSGTNQFLSRLNSSGQESIIFGPPTGFSLAQFFSVATDGSGDLWITDKHFHGVWQFTPSSSGGTYSATPFPNHAASGTAPKGIAIDGASHKWVANNSAPFPSLTELSADGATNLSSSDGFGFQVNAGVQGAYGIAIDGSGNVWVSDGASNVTEYVGAAAPTKNPIVSAITAGSFVP